MFSKKFFFLLLICSCKFFSADGSAGDRSKFFQDCVFDCKNEICRAGKYSPLLENLLGVGWSPWSCEEECEYECQWKTVSGFVERKWNVPQFHGKWPFIRIFGLQEPASAIFSIANLAINLQQLNRFRQNVPPSSPYFKLWHGYSLACLNAWTWSAIYHARDSDITERMDYMSATIMVFSAFYAMTIRVFLLSVSVTSVIFTIICAIFLVNHLAYLWLFRFDYAYNMIVNVLVGGLTVVGWIIWACVSKDHPCKRQIVSYSLLVSAATLLELMDFPPLFWTFDAHSLWHFSTCFLVIPFYNFLKEDCIYLKSLKEKELPTLIRPKME